MKFAHISDLHLGKRLHEVSLLEDQAYILDETRKILRDEEPDAVLVAGDIYDKSAPSAEAVRLFDDFLSALSADGQTVFAISGNHDSAARVAYGGRIMAKSGVYLSAPEYRGEVFSATLEDRDGPVDIYLLPFIKPIHVSLAFPEEKIESYTDALRVAVEKMPIDPKRRSVLVAHQFVTGAVRSDSEDISVGGLDNVDAVVFAPFSYVALGHIHRPQNIGSPRIRYSGAPLKYSFSEAGDEKSITMAELDGKGEVSLRTVPLTPKHDLREIKGTYDELMKKENYQDTATDDYLRVTLADEDDVPDAMRNLKTVYTNILRLDYDNTRARSGGAIEELPEAETKTPMELVAEFYAMRNGQPMSEAQSGYMRRLAETVWEEQA
ncbi:MAG: exonuclease SbcCD subunit D [Schwartzia sp.]|nr:exonuclease SbcCD subunit D [Schwartzia sp. (in: firmicutes)]MBR1759735.1 exonuclease SbcCD subunit D [Schwartzia sp. (in: firmicutes)]